MKEHRVRRLGLGRSLPKRCGAAACPPKALVALTPPLGLTPRIPPPVPAGISAQARPAPPAAAPPLPGCPSHPVPGRDRPRGRSLERRGGGAGLTPLALLCENAVENGNAAVLGGLGAWLVRVVFPEKESLANLRPRLLCQPHTGTHVGPPESRQLAG